MQLREHVVCMSGIGVRVCVRSEAGGGGSGAGLLGLRTPYLTGVGTGCRLIEPHRRSECVSALIWNEYM